MEDIEKRLRESTDACIKNFENWVKQSKDLESRESLMEAMHEVRKVLARVEIDIAISERERLGSRPIPIPPHRSQRKRSEGGDDNMGNEIEDEGFDEQPQQTGGGHHDQGRRHHQGGGRHRRPMHNRENRGGGGGNNPGNGDNQQ